MASIHNIDKKLVVEGYFAVIQNILYVYVDT